MRALRYDRYGPPDVLRVEELLEPSPGVGCAKIRVRAVGLNPVDWKIVAGHLRFLLLFRSPPVVWGSITLARLSGWAAARPSGTSGNAFWARSCRSGATVRARTSSLFHTIG